MTAKASHPKKLKSGWHLLQGGEEHFIRALVLAEGQYVQFRIVAKRSGKWEEMTLAFGEADWRALVQAMNALC